jgi:DNA-binding response OmpR family regulator
MATAYGSIELAVEAMKAGATDFLKKPLTPETLRGAVLGAISKSSRASTPTAEPSPPPLPGADAWTVNGFFIRGIPTDSDSVTEHRFLVRHAGNGPHGEVVVVLSQTEISRILRLAGRAQPPGKAFWQQQAERAVMNHLFEEAALPEGGRLAVNRLPDECVLRAREWKGA